MRIVILGAGALGGLIGARLSQAGEDVTFLEANVARARPSPRKGSSSPRRRAASATSR
jgi:Trk K+ transport system NAD-binding subunit